MKFTRDGLFQGHSVFPVDFGLLPEECREKIEFGAPLSRIWTRSMVCRLTISFLPQVFGSEEVEMGFGIGFP